jgi:hypothetical protein
MFVASDMFENKKKKHFFSLSKNLWPEIPQAAAYMYVNKHSRMCPGGVALWLSRPPTEQKIPGSNPARV